MEFQSIEKAQNRENDEVAIFIPTFSNKHLLLECVKSCISQTYHDIKIFVVDNGANDPINSIREELLAIGDSRIIYFGNATNMGSQNSFHYILSEAIETSRFMIIPADLMLVEHCVATLMDAAAENPNATMIYPRQIIRDVKKSNLNNKIDSSEESLAWPHNSSKIINTKALIKYFFDWHNLDSEWTHFSFIGALVDGRFIKSLGLIRTPLFDHGLEESICLTLLSFSEEVMVLDEPLLILYTNNKRHGSALRPGNNYTRYEPIFAEFQFLERFEPLLVRRNFPISQLYAFMIFKTLYTLLRYPGPIFLIIPTAVKALIRLIAIIIPTEIFIRLCRIF